MFRIRKILLYRHNFNDNHITYVRDTRDRLWIFHEPNIVVSWILRFWSGNKASEYTINLLGVGDMTEMLTGEKGEKGRPEGSRPTK